MGDVVALKTRGQKRGPAASLNYRSAVAPAWPPPRQVTLPIEAVRAIDRDLRHLDAVMARMRDVTTISMILSTICGAKAVAADRAARALNHFLVSGRI